VRIRVSWLPGLTLICAASAGCTSLTSVREAGVERDSLRGEIAEVRSDLEAVRRELADVRGDNGQLRRARRGQTIAARLETLDKRVGVIEGTMSDRVSALPATPQPAHPTEIPKEPPREEPRARPADPPKPGPTPDWREVTRVKLAQDDKPARPREYRAALRLVREEAYDRAIQAFYNLLRANPNSSAAPDCHYWIGESYFLMGEHYRAILSFNEVRQRYPGSRRAPDAALMIGFALLEMGNREEARLAFEKVISDYPSSREASQARERLRDFGG
jgi:tol-pal system protein YbgF